MPPRSNKSLTARTVTSDTLHAISSWLSWRRTSPPPFSTGDSRPISPPIRWSRCRIYLALRPYSASASIIPDRYVMVEDLMQSGWRWSCHPVRGAWPPRGSFISAPKGFGEPSDAEVTGPPNWWTENSAPRRLHFPPEWFLSSELAKRGGLKSRETRGRLGRNYTEPDSVHKRCDLLAEKVGFEPTVRLPVQRFSRPRSKDRRRSCKWRRLRAPEAPEAESKESHDQGANNAGCEPWIWTYKIAT